MNLQIKYPTQIKQFFSSYMLEQSNFGGSQNKQFLRDKKVVCKTSNQ